MTNNEIKLDQKATNYLKEKLGGGEGSQIEINKYPPYHSLPALNSITIGEGADAKTYAVYNNTPTPATTKLYTHMYGVKGNDRNMVFTLLSSDGTEFTVQEVIDRLESLGCVYVVGNKANSIMYPASGVDYNDREIIGVSVGENYGQKELVFIDSGFGVTTTLASALSFDIHVVAQL